MNNKLSCEICGKDLLENPKDGLIVLKKTKGQKIVDVLVVCKGKCDDILDDRLRAEGYSIGTKEMHTGLKYIYVKSDFTSEALKKYEDILEILEQA